MECELCGDMLISSRALQQHIRMDHAGDSFRCTFCSAVFRTTRLRGDHIRRCHDQAQEAGTATDEDIDVPVPFNWEADRSPQRAGSDEGQRIHEYMRLRLRFGLSEEGLAAVRVLVDSRLAAQRDALIAALPAEQRGLVADVAADFRRSLTELDVARCKRWLSDRVAGAVVPHPAGGFRIPLREAVSAFLRRFPDAYSEIQHAQEHTDLSLMTTGSVYRQNRILASGTHLAISFVFDFAVTTTNQLGVAAKGRRNFAILVAVVCNVPSVAGRPDSILMLCAMPKTLFAACEYNGFIAPFVEDLRALESGVFLLLSSASFRA